MRQPAEWAPHVGVWIGFPSHRDLWEDNLAPARAEVAAFAHAVAAGGRGERVTLVAADADAAAAIPDIVGVTVEIVPFGDIWLRDTGPIIVADGRRRAARGFAFNGWGGKYELPGDETVGRHLAARAALALRSCDWVLEGGAIDVDGSGLAVTTEQCLLNPNRNAGLGRRDIERRLAQDLGIDHLLWLGDGLANDHTDGHIDNLARFVAPGTLAVPLAAGDDDPNAGVYADARARALTYGLDVIDLPSPGRVIRDGGIVPASYMNFYIGNAAVVIPMYGCGNDDVAVRAIGALFPGRVAVGLPSNHILTGGGSFHCISQQLPEAAC